MTVPAVSESTQLNFGFGLVEYATVVMGSVLLLVLHLVAMDQVQQGDGHQV